MCHYPLFGVTSVKLILAINYQSSSLVVKGLNRPEADVREFKLSDYIEHKIIIRLIKLD